MTRKAAALSFLWASVVWGGYRVDGVAPLPLGELEARGQVADPRPSPDGQYLGFEFLGSGGDTLEVYIAPLVRAGRFPPTMGSPRTVLAAREKDPFAIGASTRPVSEHLTWGPPKRERPRLALAATRKAAERGAAQVNFDLYLAEPGRRRFLTQHPENDAQPAFSPDGEFIAYTSGRTGQGDVYLHHFYAQSDPVVRVTHEPTGSEIYPSWDATGNRLVFTGHLAGEDHVYVIDDVRSLAAETDRGRQRAAARRLTRDLTPGWKASCLAPSVSPDGKWVAFYARDRTGARADLYAVPTQGGEARRLLEKGLPETRGGPRWSPEGEGIFAVLDDAGRANPLVWIPLDPASPPQVLVTGTELNADPFPLEGEQTLLLFTAQGKGEEREKRWRRIFVARLLRGGAQ
jgi:dipeptidyl aminopeptidase/acylaminoacyl peptidase